MDKWAARQDGSPAPYEAIRRLVEMELRGSQNDRRQPCGGQRDSSARDLEGVIDLAKQGRVPVCAISLVERARADLEVYLDVINAAASAAAWSGLG